jgi:hypothetical protein
VRPALSSPRFFALVAGAVILVAGLSVRSFTGGAFAKSAGDALYAALVYAVVVFLAPRAAPLTAGTVALAFCWAVEFAQLTPVPAALSAHSMLARLVLGSTFHPPDLFWYAVGIAPLVGLHWLLRRRISHRT